MDYLVKGTILGVVCYLAFWVQTIGLDHTTPGKNAFLTATYCVIVPFAWWAIARKRPTAFNLVAAVMAVGGIGLVSLSGSLSELSMGFGDAMTPVSYTHLDVYKRQAVWSGRAVRFWDEHLGCWIPAFMGRTREEAFLQTYGVELSLIHI